MWDQVKRQFTLFRLYGNLVDFVFKFQKFRNCLIFISKRFRNTWTWGCTHEGCTLKPKIIRLNSKSIRCTHETLPPYVCVVDDVVTEGGKSVESRWLFTENETNVQKLFDSENDSPFVKDSFHRFIIDGKIFTISKILINCY